MRTTIGTTQIGQSSTTAKTMVGQPMAPQFGALGGAALLEIRLNEVVRLDDFPAPMLPDSDDHIEFRSV